MNISSTNNCSVPLNNECIICFDPVYTNDDKYICPECKIIIHSICKNNWLISNQNNQDNQDNQSILYTCPHCKHKCYIINDDNPITNIDTIVIRRNTINNYIINQHISYLLRICFCSMCSLCYVAFMLIFTYCIISIFFTTTFGVNSTII